VGEIWSQFSFQKYYYTPPIPENRILQTTSGEKMETKKKNITFIGSVLITLLILGIGIVIGGTIRDVRTVIINPDGYQSNTGKALVLSGGTITVVGEKKVAIKPEIAFVTLGIDGCSYGAENVNQLVNEKVDAVYYGLEQIGIEKSEITKTGFSLYPHYDTPGILNTAKAPFCARYWVQVKTAQLDLLSKILDTAVAAGASDIYGSSFVPKNPDEATQEGIKLAYQDAENQAKALAKSMNVSLLNVVSSEVSLDGDYLYTYYVYGGRGAAGVDPQEITVNVTVKVVYSILK
jgi:uncharacterized protein YggE